MCCNETKSRGSDKSCTEHYADSAFPLTCDAMAGSKSEEAGSRRALGQGEERELLIDAVTRTAAERGYANTTVEEVTRRAGLPPGAVDAHFADLRNCLVAAFDAYVERMETQVRSAIDLDAEWSEQVRTSVAAAIEFLLETASRARVFTVEAVAAGPPFLERYIATIERVAELLRRGRKCHPRAAGLPASAESVLLGGISLQVRACLLAEEERRLVDLEAEFVELLLYPYLGERDARRLAGVR